MSACGEPAVIVRVSESSAYLVLSPGAGDAYESGVD